MIDLLREFVDCVGAREAEFSDAEVQASLDMGPMESENPGAWLDMVGPKRMVRLTVWASGEANLTVLDSETGELIEEQHVVVTSTFGLADLLQDVIAWATGRSEDP